MRRAWRPWPAIEVPHATNDARTVFNVVAQRAFSRGGRISGQGSVSRTEYVIVRVILPIMVLCSFLGGGVACLVAGRRGQASFDDDHFGAGNSFHLYALGVILIGLALCQMQMIVKARLNAAEIRRAAGEASAGAADTQDMDDCAKLARDVAEAPLSGRWCRHFMCLFPIATGGFVFGSMILNCYAELQANNGTAAGEDSSCKEGTGLGFGLALVLLASLVTFCASKYYCRCVWRGLWDASSSCA